MATILHKKIYFSNSNLSTPLQGQSTTVIPLNWQCFTRMVCSADEWYDPSLCIIMALALMDIPLSLQSPHSFLVLMEASVFFIIKLQAV